MIMGLIVVLGVPSVLAKQKQNVLMNGDFEQGLEYWQYWSYGCQLHKSIQEGRPINCGYFKQDREILMYPIVGVAPVKDNQNALKVVVQGDAEDADWKTQVQTTLEKGKTFGLRKGRMLLRFWAKSAPTELSVVLNEAFEPYANLGLYQKFTPGPEWTLYEFVFDAKASESATLIFNLGKVKDYTRFFLDEVELFYVSEPVILNRNIQTSFGEKVVLEVENVFKDGVNLAYVPVYDFSGSSVKESEISVPVAVMEEKEKQIISFNLPSHARTGSLSVSSFGAQSRSIHLSVKPVLRTRNLNRAYAPGDVLELRVSGITPRLVENYVSFEYEKNGKKVRLLKPVYWISDDLNRVRVRIPKQARSGLIGLEVRSFEDGEFLSLKSTNFLYLKLVPRFQPSLSVFSSQ